MTNNHDINEIIYFGDSLTDSGAFFEIADLVLTQPFPSALFGYDGQFSNGDVYADVAPDLLDVSVQNFAVGGARAVGTAPAVFLPFGPLGEAFLDPAATAGDIAFVSNFDINLGGQIERYLATLEGGFAAPGTAASLFIGLNDFNAFAPTEGGDIIAEFTALAGGVLASTLGAAQALLQTGISTVFINNLPPADFFPSFQFAPPEIQAIGVDALEGYNETLVATAGQVFGSAVEIIRLDVIAKEIMDDPTAFGFLNVTDAKFFGTGGDPTILDTPDGPVPFFAENPALDGLDEDQFAFYDLLHFTTALHGVIGAFTAGSIEDELSILTEGDDRQRFSHEDDLVLAGAGNDSLRLGGGDDVALGGQGRDFIRGQRGDDILSGGSGNDKLRGGSGDDVVGGGQGRDFLFGDAGDDVLIDGLGSDVVLGGRGNDAFLYTEASLIGGATGDDRDLFIGGTGHDTLYLALTDETRELVEADLSGRYVERLADIGLTTIGIEQVVFVDDRTDLADVEADARIGEADLWGLV